MYLSRALVYEEYTTAARDLGKERGGDIYPHFLHLTRTMVVRVGTAVGSSSQVNLLRPDMLYRVM